MDETTEFAEMVCQPGRSTDFDSQEVYRIIKGTSSESKVQGKSDGVAQDGRYVGIQKHVMGSVSLIIL